MEFMPGRLREARNHAGLSRRALGALVNRNLSTVGRWEHGDTLPNVEDCARCAFALGVSQEWLTGADEVAPITGLTPEQERVDLKNWREASPAQRQMLRENLADLKRAAAATSTAKA